MTKLSKSHLWVYTISAFAALAGLLFGYDTGVISGAILFIRQDFTLTPGLTEITISAVLLGALIGSGISGKITDILGRRKVLISTALIFIIGSISTALAPTVYWLIIGRIILGFAMSVGCMVWLVISEIFPLEIRGMGVSIAVSLTWGFNMLVALTFLTLIDSFGASGTFWIYASLCLLAWLFVYFVVPETKGCSLEQIEHNLRLGKRARDLGLPTEITSSISSKKKAA